MAVLVKNKVIAIVFVVCTFLLVCTPINFELADESPQIIVENTKDTVTVGDQYTVLFDVVDNKDSSDFLINNTSVSIVNEFQDTMDIDSFTAFSGEYTIILITTDSDGNTSQTVKFTVVVSDEDKTPPAITLLGPVPYVLNRYDTYEEPRAMAMDNVDGDVSDNIEISGEVNTSDIDEYTITYTVQDQAGNKGSAFRKVQVKPNNDQDKEKPKINLKGDNPVTVYFGTVFNDPGATATDNIDGNITWKMKKYTAGVNTQKAGIYHVYYSVEDNAGNITIAERSVKVVIHIDSIPPVIDLLGDNPISLKLGEHYNEPGARAIDDVDGDISDKIEINNSDLNINANGNYNILYSVSDASGNKATAKRRVSVGVIDTIPPSIILLGPNPMLLDYKGTFKDPGAYAKDDVDDSIPFAYFKVVPEINFNQLGTYKVTYTVSDNADNTSSKERTVEVVDTIKPVIKMKGSAVINLAIGYPYTEYGATATDNFDGDMTAKLDTIGQVNTSVSGEYKITYRVTDSHNNTGEAIRTVNILTDVVPPVITLLGNDPMQVKINTTYKEPGAYALDNIDDSIPFSKFTTVNGINLSQIGTYTVKYSVSDAAGNGATKERTVQVVNEILYLDTFMLTIRMLDKTSSTGSAYGRVGAGARGSTSTYSFETLMYNALSGMTNKTISLAKVLVRVSGVNSSTSGKTATLYEQNKGAYNASASYSTYPATGWTASVGTMTATTSSRDVEINTTQLKDLVQAWLKGQKQNRGLILGGTNFTDSQSSYWKVDYVKLVIVSVE